VCVCVFVCVCVCVCVCVPIHAQYKRPRGPGWSEACKTTCCRRWQGSSLVVGTSEARNLWLVVEGAGRAHAMP